MTRYLRIWLQLAVNELLITLSSRVGTVFFFIGKAFRYGVFLVVLWSLRTQITSISGFSIDQMYIFFLSYSMIDLVSQILFRSTYNMSELVTTGNLDLVLVKPIHPLFRSLLGQPDINDFLFLIPVSIITAILISRFSSPSSSDLILGFVMFLTGMMISMTMHILICALSIVLLEVNNLVFMLRDLSSMARFPMEIYTLPIRVIMEFVIPIGLMMNLPARALLGMLTPQSVIISLAIAATFLVASFWLWNQMILRYSSASS